MKHSANKILIILFLIINGIVLYNAIFHPPWIGYDAEAHIVNIKILSQFRLPVRQESAMFYMPPLYYILPAILNSLNTVPFIITLKFAQLLNVIYSIGLVFFLMKICDIIRPKNTAFKIITLLFLGMITAYYKTFAFIRSEPLLAFLTILAIYLTLRLAEKKPSNYGTAIALGITIGFALLTKHTAVFPAVAIISFILISAVKIPEKRKFYIKSSAIILLFVLLISGWFYLNLYKNYGSAKIFNIKIAPGVYEGKKQRTFMDKTGLPYVFREPVRKYFKGSVVPIFYSELWGDYLCFFVVYGIDKRTNEYISGKNLAYAIYELSKPSWLYTNRDSIKKYLGRVNIVSIIPSFIMIIGIIYGLICCGRMLKDGRENKNIFYFSLLEITILFTIIGFVYFLFAYPSPKGDNAKATYIANAFPIFAILASQFMCLLKEKSKMAFTIILTVLIIIFLYNFPVHITRYSPFINR